MRMRTIHARGLSGKADSYLFIISATPVHYSKQLSGQALSVLPSDRDSLHGMSRRDQSLSRMMFASNKIQGWWRRTAVLYWDTSGMAPPQRTMRYVIV